LDLAKMDLQLIFFLYVNDYLSIPMQK